MTGKPHLLGLSVVLALRILLFWALELAQPVMGLSTDPEGVASSGQGAPDCSVPSGQR